MQKIRTIDNQFYRELGRKIREMREKKDITQRELAKGIGTSRALISDYENGYTKISPNRWNRICTVLGISSDIEINVEVGHKYARYH